MRFTLIPGPSFDFFFASHAVYGVLDYRSSIIRFSKKVHRRAHWKCSLVYRKLSPRVEAPRGELRRNLAPECILIQSPPIIGFHPNRRQTQHTSLWVGSIVTANRGRIWERPRRFLAPLGSETKLKRCRVSPRGRVLREGGFLVRPGL